MNKIIESFRKKAKSDPKRIAFPESLDKRILAAVRYIKKEGIAVPYTFTSNNLNRQRQEEFAKFFYNLGRVKDLTLQETRVLMENPLCYAAMMVRCGYVDGFVAGAEFTTSSVVKAAINFLEIDKTIGFISSCFIMIVPDCSYGEKGVFVYADCGVIPRPTSEQLANIAIASANFTRNTIGITPRVAFLSFSTKGSAGGRGIDKIKEALKIAKTKDDSLLIDGELQADSALVPEVAVRKLGKSEVAGYANVLIFPDLGTGNICYKLTERLAKAKAIGPIILGTKQPCGDLSRGCSVEDIIDSTAITVVRAQNRIREVVYK